MFWKEINLEKYISEIRQGMKVGVSDEMIKKDLLLTLILSEMEKRELGKELIFKGGTLLARNYLNYHRFSEDLDFVHKDSGILRDLPRSNREKKIKNFMDSFVPKLKEVADSLELDFSTDRSNTKFCTILHGRTVYTFRMYYTEAQYIKVEINFIEKMINPPNEVSVKAITDFFDSKGLLFILNLSYEHFNVLSYTIEEILLEKYRAVLTRKYFQERDLFDLFLIKGSLKADISKVIEKIKTSSLIKRNLQILIEEKLNFLKQGQFFKSEERIEDLAARDYNEKEFESFKQKIEPILIDICEKFLSKLD